MDSKNRRPTVSGCCYVAGIATLLAALGVACLWPIAGEAYGQVPAPGTPRPGPNQMLPPHLPPTGLNFPQMPKPLVVVTLGDSIMWGQGVPEAFKFRTLVTQRLQGLLPQRRVIQVPTKSHSGAVTGWTQYPPETGGQDPDTFYMSYPNYPYPGELPFGYPTISHQIAMTINDLPRSNLKPSDISLVLLDGGINDVHVTNILDPAHSSGKVAQMTQDHCVAHMQNLLPQVLAAFPNAVVVMTGYFPIVSDGTDSLKLTDYIGLLNLPADAFLKSQLTRNSSAFADTALSGFFTIVADANRGLKSLRVAVAWPYFAPENSYAADHSYLWMAGMFSGEEARGYVSIPPAQDTSTPAGVAYNRSRDCHLAMNTNSPTCLDASMGHPNLAGSQAYADAIMVQLQTQFATALGLPRLPAPPPIKLLNLGARRGNDDQGGWIIVQASDRMSGRGLSGKVQVFRQHPNQPTQPEALVASGATGQKLHVDCERVDAVAGGGNPAARQPGAAGAAACDVVVNVAGYPSARLPVNTPP